MLTGAGGNAGVCTGELTGGAVGGGELGGGEVVGLATGGVDVGGGVEESGGVAKVGGFEGGNGGTGDALIGDIAGACALASTTTRNRPYNMQTHLKLAIFLQMICQENEGSFLNRESMNF